MSLKKADSNHIFEVEVKKRSTAHSIQKYLWKNLQKSNELVLFEPLFAKSIVPI